jgi:DNA-binding protein HU-beta
LIKADIVDQIVERLVVAHPKAATSVETVIASLRDALMAGDRIELRGFGVFEVRKRKVGIGRNPKTRVEVAIPPGNSIRFKPGKKLRQICDCG